MNYKNKSPDIEATGLVYFLLGRLFFFKGKGG
jgi:hypothetical protein